MQILTTITLRSGEIVPIDHIGIWTGKKLLKIFENEPGLVRFYEAECIRDSAITPLRWVVCSEYVPDENTTIEHVIAEFVCGNVSSIGN